ncbi:DUF3119 family protein [Thermoleptolyngbya sp. M55_K2018_002]|uniref:DUF3119 family protein n=1 Tax=Thermoleptolyngbya sp. M55_K2018_002 TaxID=2747808 RepID=UPI001A0EB893|nr:DUF3119 family protein [Thermoleptolyngbya sp. M55_K2018_002]HIK39296.1 DUF3119 family protein [Thermoleptolyngbya sp. M55_K2018_002]
MNSPSAIAPTDTVQLAPSYRLPIGLLLLALPLVWLLLVQTATLRLHFTDIALDIFRGETRIRRFPYQDWQNWAIFWSPVPILFYFKEVNSIHFLPILFDPKALQACLEQRCPTVSE